MNEKSIRCSILRGGTSKGVFLFAEDLPSDTRVRDQIIKKIMGTPDPRQINGLGGADILTSKVAIIGKPTCADADVDYTFAQVGIDKDTISYEGNCGNISAAVGPFALESGIIKPDGRGGASRSIRIHNTNIKKIIKVEIPMQGVHPLSAGDYKIDGVPGSGAKITVDFSESVGSLSAGLLSTGNAKDILVVPKFGEVEVSFVDLSNPVVFIKAASLGLVGNESGSALESNRELIETMEDIRGMAALRLGFVADGQNAFELSPYVPFFCIVAPGSQDSSSEVDIISRVIGYKRVHKTFPGTGAVCLAAASVSKGTVVNECLERGKLKRPGICTIAHPSGLLEVEIEMQGHKVTRAAFGRTWHRIMDGIVYI